MLVLSEPTEKSPLITLDGDVLTISGRSYMSNAVDYYRSILYKIADLNQERLSVIVAMEYFNTSSSKCLLEIFKTVARKAESGMKVTVLWKYTAENPEMLETGEDYRDLITSIPFDIVKEG